MSTIRHKEQSWHVGVDVGGTWVRVIVLGGGRPAARLRMPAPPLRELGKCLLSLWKRRGWAQRDVAALVVAARGVWTLQEGRKQARLLRRRGGGGGRRARAIVREGQRRLATLVVEVARRLALRRPVPISWAGSVLDDAWFRAGLRRAVASQGLRARWLTPAAEPVEAAARLATRLDRPGPRR